MSPSPTLAPHRATQRWIAATGCAALASMTLAALLVHMRLEETLKQQLSALMNASLATAVASVHAWHDRATRAAHAAAADPDMRDRGARCLQTRECADLTEVIAPYMIASDLSGGRVVPRAEPSTERVAVPLKSLPIDVALTSSNGTRIGTLELDLALAPLSRLLMAARVGRSGETYVFDKRARMLTLSRFVAANQQAGTIVELTVPSKHTGAHTGEEPSYNARASYTEMAKRALAGESGANVEGYLDYRGVPVVGTWQWIPELQLGVVTELDVADAFRTLTTLKRMFTGLSVALLIAVAASFLAARRASALRRRAEIAERRAEEFGQYQIERKLGEGGMGSVYLASHALLRRKAAIKVLRPDRVSPDALARFEREAQITSTLTHANTVALYDFGRTKDGTFYYAMEYLEGLDLQRLVERFGPLPSSRVIHFLRQVCGSLAEAHVQGIVHRDIKPANLLACTRGGVMDRLKVLDFGIVHVGSLDEGKQPIVLGTPEYMAPELFESATRASAQSDLYSVGVVAYYLLTGTPPFSGAGTTQLELAHLTEAPEPLSLVLGDACDPTLESAIVACLRKQPHARPASAASLRALLERSVVASAWTQADAEAWWSERDAQLTELRGSAVSESLPNAVAVRTSTQ